MDRHSVKSKYAIMDELPVCNMEQIVFHIGNFKTGTTSIQKFLDSNTGYLSEHQFTYAKRFRPAKNHSNHSILALEYLRGHIHIPGWYLEEYSSHRVLADLRDEIYECKTRSLLISSEEFFRAYRGNKVHEDRIGSLRSLIKSISKDITVVILASVREPFSWLKSWYFQGNKQGYYSHDFIRFFVQLERNLISQHETISLYKDYLGDKTIAWAYNDAKTFDAITSFMASLGVPASSVAELQLEQYNSNVTSKDISSIEIDRVIKKRVMSYDDATYSKGFDIEKCCEVINQIETAYLAMSNYVENLPVNNLSVVNILDFYGTLSSIFCRWGLINDRQVDLLRDQAIKYESLYREESLACMKLAGAFRPTGSFIKKKLEYYLNQ